MPYSLENFRKFPGQLWLSEFEILYDEVTSLEEAILLWRQIKMILSAGFDGMNHQVKELFLPAFSMIGKGEEIEEISEASLLLI